MAKSTLAFFLLLFATIPAIAEKPCIAFSGRPSLSEADREAQRYLQTAVTLSGDYVFYPDFHLGCWTVYVLTLSIKNTAGYPLGYAISWATTNGTDVMIDHGIQTGPDTGIFDKAMRDAAAVVVANIRTTQDVANALNKLKESK